MPAKPKRPKKQAAYLLPVGLIRDIKRLAVDEECYPAELVRRIMVDHFDRKAKGRKGQSA